MLQRLRPDRLGLVLTASGLAALLWLPFVVFKTNRIVPGVPHALFEVLTTPAAIACLAAWILVAIAALWSRHAGLRLGAALLGIAMAAWAIAAACNALTPAGNQVVRVAPGSGFWLLLVSLALAATDAVTRLQPRPAQRVLLLALVIAALSGAFAVGLFDNLSMMREYAVNAERFGRELRTHLLLALGSLAAALLVATPIGILCHRVPWLRAGVLGALNFIQTIPAIALFGILMVPLAALAAASPTAAALGIQGIGAAPAVVALFLYSLLPIVANMVAGLGRVSPGTVLAARGMGMTAGQILARVELPLALPVILTGIRIVLVQNIGLVAIAALIGAGGLGAFIFQGIGQAAIDLVLLGTLPIIAISFGVAVLLDAFIETIDRVPR